LIQNRAANRCAATTGRSPHRFLKPPEAPKPEDFVNPYVQDLANVVDLEAIRSAG
jgi:phosphoglucomutase